MQAATNALALSPTLQQIQQVPIENQLRAGGFIDAFNQQRINDAMQRFNEINQADTQNFQEFASTVFGLPGLGGSTTTGTGGRSGGILGGIGGGAAMAGLLGSGPGAAALGLLPAAAAGPVGGGLMALGVLAGLFG